MKLWWKHTYQVFETWAFCLLRNHFHVAGFFKNKEDLAYLKLKEPAYGYKWLQTHSRATLFCYEFGALIFSKLRGWV